MSRRKRLIEDRSPFTVHRSPFTVHGADEQDKRALDPVARIQNVCGVNAKSKPPTQFELRFQFTGRTESDFEKPCLLFLSGPAAAFCDVRRHRDGRPPYLSREIEPLVRGEGSSQFIDLHSQGRGFLPDSKIAIFLDSPSLHRSRSRCKGHKTSDSVRERDRLMAVNGRQSTVDGQRLTVCGERSTVDRHNQ